MPCIPSASDITILYPIAMLSKLKNIPATSIPHIQLTEKPYMYWLILGFSHFDKSCQYLRGGKALELHIWDYITSVSAVSVEFFNKKYQFCA